LLDAVIGNLGDAFDRLTATPDDDGETGGGRDGRDGTGRTRERFATSRPSSDGSG
jgi:hypothetical protein